MKTAISIITAGLLIALFIILLNDADSKEEVGSFDNIEINDGVQYITILAKGGYSPSVTNAESGIPTILIMKTDNTYDCSLALVIRSINFQEMLEPNGEKVIDLGTPKPGTLRGLCSMGMYNFSINFN